MGIEFVESEYFVTESFYSLQGEGVYSGKAAFFIRLSGCNVGCRWCDSKDSWAIGSGEAMSVEQLCRMVTESGARIVVITGGEPMLHDLGVLTTALRELGVRIHIETSGSEQFSGVFDWITLSPKRGKKAQRSYFSIANELKVIIECDEDFEQAERYAELVRDSCVLLLQSEWGVRDIMMPKIIEFIKKKNNWGLSLQTHKFIEVQ